MQAKNPPLVNHDGVEQNGGTFEPVLRMSTRVTHPPDKYVTSLDYVMLTYCDQHSCDKEVIMRDDKQVGEVYEVRNGFGDEKFNLGVGMLA